MSRRTGRPAGRPTKIDQVLTVRDDGSTETIADRVLAHIRAGNYVETAAEAAGITKQTLYHWLKTGAQTQVKLTAGTSRRDCTRFQLLCAEFSDAVHEADSWATATDVANAARLARGLPRRTVTEKLEPVYDSAGQPVLDAQGQPVSKLVERTVRIEDPEPDGAMIRWRLERKHPELFGRRTRIELTGLGGGPVEVEMTVEQKREHLADVLGKIAGRLGDDPAHQLDAAAIEATSRQLVPAPAELESDGEA